MLRNCPATKTVFLTVESQNRRFRLVLTVSHLKMKFQLLFSSKEIFQIFSSSSTEKLPIICHLLFSSLSLFLFLSQKEFLISMFYSFSTAASNSKEPSKVFKDQLDFWLGLSEIAFAHFRPQRPLEEYLTWGLRTLQLSIGLIQWVRGSRCTE